MDKPLLDLAQCAHADFYAFIGQVSLLLVEHNIDAITVTMFLREIVDAGGHAQSGTGQAHCLPLCGHGQQTYLTRVAVLAHAKIRSRSMSSSEKRTCPVARNPSESVTLIHADGTLPVWRGILYDLLTPLCGATCERHISAECARRPAARTPRTHLPGATRLRSKSGPLRGLPRRGTQQTPPPKSLPAAFPPASMLSCCDLAY